MRALVVLVLALAVVGGAAADGDPASDVLVAANVFTPYPAPSAAAAGTLASAVQAVSAKGDRVKVAVIATKQDLGSVPSLYGHPQDYAKFLSLELAFVYTGPLLVVMPDGFGCVDKSAAVPASAPVLAGVSIRSDTPDDLALAAAKAVSALERAGLLHYRDVFAPLIYPLPASVIGGRRVALHYEVFDDSGRANVELQVRKRATVVTRFHVRLSNLTSSRSYFVVWRAPVAFAHRQLQFCAQATDPTGNRSTRRCAQLTVK